MNFNLTFILNSDVFAINIVYSIFCKRKKDSDIFIDIWI